MKSFIKVLFLERMFVERGTHKLFVPLVQITHVNDDGSSFIVYKDDHFICGESFLNDRFIEIVPTWDALFSFNPITRLLVRGEC